MKILFLLVCSIFLIVFAGPASAQRAPDQDTTNTNNPNAADRSNRIVDKSEKQRANVALERYKNARNLPNRAERINLGKKMVDEKIIIRKVAVERINILLTTGNCSRLAPVYLDPIRTEMSELVVNLNSQTTRNQTITTTEEIRDLTASVLQENRIFSVVVPAVRGACASGRLLERLASISEITIKTLPENDNTLEIKNLILSAQESTRKAYDGFLSALSTRDANSVEAIKQARESLQTARNQLKEARELTQVKNTERTPRTLTEPTQ